ncbi:hypothetical protein [Sorangium sp. So ce590]|uniref:hypothetical protein n=1 Tax=unclassified Sorangium TaxID=2621164 RepID=UPI003F5F61A2
MNHALLRSALSGLLLAACGGSVDTPPGSGGAGGAGAAGGTGGAGGDTSSTSSGGGTPVVCGGRSGGICGAEEYCDFPDDSCGTFDSEGQCSARPGGCPADCPGVCGCDGQFYCNACGAHQAGVDVSENISCIDPVGGDYTATYWPGGLDHLVVYKAEPEADRCVMLYADAPVESAPAGLDVAALPEGWVVTRIAVTRGAADCAPGDKAPAGEAVHATDATGILAMDLSPGTAAPCTLDVDITATFPGEPATARLRATGVTVNDGCL